MRVLLTDAQSGISDVTLYSRAFPWVCTYMMKTVYHSKSVKSEPCQMNVGCQHFTNCGQRTIANGQLSCDSEGQYT